MGTRGAAGLSNPNWRREPGVYFIWDGIDRFKIGWSNDPGARCRKLQTGNSHRLSLIAVDAASDPSAELRWHQLFAEDRRHGEWFHVSQRLIAAVEQVQDHNGCVGAPAVPGSRADRRAGGRMGRRIAAY